VIYRISKPEFFPLFELYLYFLGYVNNLAARVENIRPGAGKRHKVEKMQSLSKFH